MDRQKPDIHNYHKKLQRGYEKLEKSKTSQHNKDLIIQFLEAHETKMGVPRRAKYLYTLRFYAEWLDKDFDKATKNDLRSVVKKHVTKNTEISEATRHHYLVMLKAFYKWLADPDSASKYRNTPDIVRWIETNNSNNKLKDPEDILDEKDILAMLDEEPHPRNKAIIATLWDSGARVTEFLTLRIKDVRPDEHGCQIHIWESKTKSRVVRLTFASPYLLSWINLHAYRNNPNAPLWVPLNVGGRIRHGGAEDKPMAYGSLKILLDRCAKAAKIYKKVNPHAWRSASATFASKRGMPQSMMCLKYGWSASSDMPAHYISLSNKDVGEWELEQAGMIRKQKAGEGLAPIRCRRCDHMNEATRLYCEGCHLPLKSEAAMALELETNETQKDIVDMLKDPEALALLEQAMAIVQKKRLLSKAPKVTIFPENPP